MDIEDLDLALALRRLADASEPPPIDPRREAALMAAFDRAALAPAVVHRPYWGMAGLAATAALLIAVGVAPVRTGRHGSVPPPPVRDARVSGAEGSTAEASIDDPQPPSEFVLVPGAAALPRMESGSLVRMDVPVSMLPSLGIAPPASSVTRVRADLIVGQDGLTRAVRLVD